MDSEIYCCLYHDPEIEITVKLQYQPLKRQSRLADDIFKACYSYFLEEIMLDITCESSAWQTIHM